MNNTADGSRTDEVIALEGVELRRGGRLLLDGIDWHVRAGECAAIVGPNGAGKSTLLSVIGGFTWPQEGRVRVFGETYGRVELATLSRRMGFAGSSRMPQFHDDQTAFEVVLAGRYGATVVPPRVEPTGPDLDAVERQLAVVGLAGRAQM